MIREKKVLVIDDNPFNRELIRGLLDENFTVSEAANGKEGLERIRHRAFDLVIMDLLMPVMDGFETARNIRRMGFKMPIIAVSAISFKQDKTRAIEAGCTDFLPKPIEAEGLFAVIEKSFKNLEEKSASNEISYSKRFKKPITEYTILLLESDEKTAEQYTNFFEDSGFNVLRSADGNEAIKFLRKHKWDIDIIVSNIHTPGIDAIGLLTLVKREFPDKLFFIYTPHYDYDTFQLAIQQGVDGISPFEQVETSMLNTIISAMSSAETKGSKTSNAVASKQLRTAQSQLIQYGCLEGCEYCDMAYSSIHEAGGDIARCKQFNLAGRCGIVLADVAGHDVLSSYISAMFLGLLSSHWDKNQEPVKLLDIINTEFHKLGFKNSHICVTAVLVDRLRRMVKIATAGNPGGILIKKNQNGSFEIKELTGGGMCLGLLRDNDLYVYEEAFLENGGYIILFSDGIETEEVLETVNSRLELFDNRHSTGISQQLLDVIFANRSQDDDVIMICLYVDEKISNKYLFSFKSSYEGVNNACAWAREVLSPDSIPAEKDYDLLMLSLREALLNAVEHGNGSDPNKFVDIEIGFMEDAIRMDVSDEGSGFDFASELKEIKKLDNFQVGKRGIILIEKTADRFEVSGGTVSMFF